MTAVRSKPHSAWLRNALIGVAVVLVVAGAWLFAPLGRHALRSHPAPVTQWERAAERVRAVEDAESSPVFSPEGRSIALLRAAPAETAVVIFHGYTSVPAQFALVARGWYEAGANVWVPRMPGHGEANRMTDDLTRITPDGLRAWTDSVLDVAHGLGRRVVVIGLSGGGALATWSAAERPDVAGAIVLSPLLVPAGYPAWGIRPLARAVLALPDQWVWWNDQTREREPGPGYPRYSLHGVASYLLLGQRAIADGARGSRPIAGTVTLLVNDFDETIDPAAAVERLRALVPSTRLRVVEIPTADSLRHDLVMVDGDNRSRIGDAYAWLARAMGVRLPDPVTSVGGHALDASVGGR